MAKIDKMARLPSSEQVEAEMRRVRFNTKYFRLLRSTVYALIVTAAVSVLVATLFLPVLQIYGTSMSPTLTEGEIVVSIKQKEYTRGDIIALYYSNKVLVKRIIGVGDDVIQLTDEGTFIINGEELVESYISKKAYGDLTDIEFPFTVPKNTYFVVGDHRETSIDSRSTQIGCVEPSEVVGRIVFSIWPFSEFGKID